MEAATCTQHIPFLHEPRKTESLISCIADVAPGIPWRQLVNRFIWPRVSAVAIQKAEEQLEAVASPGLSGDIPIPRDKSMSHRALILGARAEGTTVIRGLLESEYVLHTDQAVRSFGATIERCEGAWPVTGTRWQSPARPSLIAAVISPGSNVRALSVMINPPRAGLFDTLRAMGARLVVTPRGRMSGEAVADITAAYGPLGASRSPPSARRR